MPVGQQDRAARFQAVDGRQQFVHRRDADHLSLGRRKGRGFFRDQRRLRRGDFHQGKDADQIPGLRC